MKQPKLVMLILGLCVVGCDDSFCGAYTTEVDGVCVGEDPIEPDAPVSIDEVITSESPCEGLAAGSGLDLRMDARCADQVCIGDTVEEAVQAIGREPLCEVARAGVLRCEWAPGAATWLVDDDGDGQPDDREASIVRIQLDRNYLGATTDGLAVSVGASCFVDVLGPPDQYLLNPSFAGRWVVGSASWFDGGVVIEDGVAPYLFGDPDGTLDVVVLQ